MVGASAQKSPAQKTPPQFILVTNRRVESAGNDFVFSDELSDELRVFLCHRFVNVNLLGQEIKSAAKVAWGTSAGKHWRSFKSRVNNNRQQQKFFYEEVLLEKLVVRLGTMVEQDDSGRPWVMFIHGNNQTFEQSIKNCRYLQKVFDVNLVVFSWPSRSYNPRSLEQSIASLLLSVHPATRLLSRLTMLKAVYDRHKQYHQARIFADQSCRQLENTLELLNQALFKPLLVRAVPVHLLVHSLGNYLLSKTITESRQPISVQFQSAIVHQADMPLDDGLAWLRAIPLSEPRRLYVTHNRQDYALFLSGLWHNRWRYRFAFSRLGNGLDLTQQYPFQVLDVSGLRNLGVSHGVLWHRDLSAELKQKINSIWRCK